MSIISIFFKQKCNNKRKKGLIFFMFTWEIKNYINQKRGVVSREEFHHLINKVDNPQIIDVKHEGSLFSIKTSDDGEEIMIAVKH